MIKWNGKIQQDIATIESISYRLKNGGVWMAVATDTGDPIGELEAVFDAAVKLDKLAKYAIESKRVSLAKAMEIMETTDDDIVSDLSNAVGQVAETLYIAPGASGRELTDASKWATACAMCGEFKHTPIRNVAMGGYVCLTCIDRELTRLQSQNASAEG